MGSPPSKSFGNGQYIGCNIKLFKCEKRPGPAHPTLDLIENKQSSCFIAPFSQRFHVGPGWNPDTRIPLNSLDNNASRSFGNQVEIGYAIKVHKGHTGKQGSKGLLFCFIAGDAHGAVRATGVLRRYPTGQPAPP